MRVLLLLLLWAGSAIAQTPTTATIIDVPGARQTQAFGINNVGQIVGYYQGQDGGQHAFVRDYGGSYMEINYPGARLTMATGVNDAGTIVGCYEDANGVLHGYTVDHAGTYKSIDVAGASLTLASGINNAGVVVGYYSRAGRDRGFIWNAGAFITADFDFITGDVTHKVALHTYPAGINDRGDIVGGFVPDNGKNQTGGFFYVAAEQHFATTGGGYVWAVNNGTPQYFVGQFGVPEKGVFGHIIKPSYVSQWSQAMFSSACCLFYQNGVAIGWRQPDWVVDFGLGVNDAKMVVGYYIGADRLSHAFMFDCGKC
jgi:probable HAF family extracellular repeat protein